MNDIIKLIKTTVSTEMNEQGDYDKILTRRQIFADVKSIGTKEFYEAATAGMKPEIKFVIQDYLDYEGEKELSYNGFRYPIIRTFRTQTNQLEITVGGGVREIADT
jgi:SPP1 family predicted phage head-tail adaptor